MTSIDNQRVTRGHLTFNSEGNNIRGSVNYSRVIHYPPRGISGVTIGRGYDMGARSREQVFRELTRAGIPHEQARAIAAGASKRGHEAADFVRLHRTAIGEITEQQQAMLFNNIYPGYEQRAKTVYNLRTEGDRTRTAWQDLHPAIRDVLVDIIYQGYQGTASMPIASRNDIDSMIRFIRNHRELSVDELNRNRAEYLNANRGRR